MRELLSAYDEDESGSFNEGTVPGKRRGATKQSRDKRCLPLATRVHADVDHFEKGPRDAPNRSAEDRNPTPGRSGRLSRPEPHARGLHLDPKGKPRFLAGDVGSE